MVAKRSLRQADAITHYPPQALGNCPLCSRPLVAGRSVDEHHLVPKSQGGRATSTVHRVCHRKIHATFTEKELARSFASWAELLAHPEIDSFVGWVQKKAPEYYDNSAKPARRR